MTGPEHYQKAQDLLSAAAETESTDLAADLQQAAQVHATLALAAATASQIPMSDPQGYDNGGIIGAWAKAGAL